MVQYDSIHFGQDLAHWVDSVQAAIASQYGMPWFVLERGSYGYDSYARILDAILSAASSRDILQYLRGSMCEDGYIAAAHSAWSACYIEWKNAVDVQMNNPECNDRATSHVCNLSEDDLTMYRDIVVEVFDQLSQRVLEQGMAQLSL